MSDRKLVVSFGLAKNLAEITSVGALSWPEVVEMFTRAPPEHEDKAAAGWYCFAEFDPVYRDSDNLVARHALTFDYDHVTKDDVKTIRETYNGYEYVIYTTASHTNEKPRLRMLLPLSRPASYDEFQAVSRKVASYAGIELCAREAQVPAQCMFMPTVKPSQKFKAAHNKGEWVDVELQLSQYADWADRSTWPKRQDGDGTHSHAEKQIDPCEKPGLIGAFCKAFSIEDCIERFNLPYERAR